MTDTPDPNQTAHQAVQQATAKAEEPLPADLEAAWKRWSAGVGKADARGMALLRAAFEAGWVAGGRVRASAQGRSGGLKGGKARADKLSSEKRSEIAKRAAESRWSKEKKS